jgi:hypothetical protein
LRLSDVARRRGDVETLFAQPCSGRFETVARKIVDGDSGSRSGEKLHRGQANPRSSAGDESALAVELVCEQ